jgi:hypothetical protein
MHYFHKLAGFFKNCSVKICLSIVQHLTVILPCTSYSLGFVMPIYIHTQKHKHKEKYQEYHCDIPGGGQKENLLACFNI